MTKPPFAETYTGRIRAKFGSELLLMPSARTVVVNGKGEILCIRRADDGFWALPAGLPEAGESITQCAVREVLEETGITVGALAAFGFSSKPEVETHVYPNGDRQQAFVTLFYCTEFSGTAHVHDDETLDVRFFARAAMPDRARFLKCDWRTLEMYDEFQRTRSFICE